MRLPLGETIEPLPSVVRDHQLDTLIHRGFSTEVWTATRLGPAGFGVPVALKTLSESCMATPEYVRTFVHEARAASCVQHRNVVQIRELFLDDRGRHWICMDLVAGWPVRALLSAIEASGQPIPIPVALAFVRDAARGLQAIHDAGLVHRDVCPNNLMVASAGHLVVHDFGRATWPQTDQARITPSPDAFDAVYSSPDMRARLPVDARTDVFSLGALLDQMIPERRGAPIALDAIIRRALDPDTARRFPSAQALEVAIDLVSIREGWLVPPSYVAAYLCDVFRSAAFEIPRPRPVVRTAAPKAAVATPPLERAPTEVNRTVLPRGHRGMVGVGAMLPGAPVKNDPAVASVPRPAQPQLARMSLVSRSPTAVTRIRVRR